MSVKPRTELQARAGVDHVRFARRGAGSLSFTLLVTVAVALVLAISIKLRHRWDLSQSGGNSLSPQTRAVLAAVSGEVGIYPLFTTGNPRKTSYWHRLELYREACPRITVEFIDPVAQPGAVNRLGLDPEQESARRDGMTVVAYGENRRIFEGIREEDVTNAIMDVTSTAPRVVGFIRGYGERDPAGERDAGLLRAVEALAQEYYRIGDVLLTEPIPAEVKVLVVAGPRLPMAEAELARLQAWLEAGGRLLVLADPGADLSINSVLERWGLRVTSEQVIEPRQNLRNDPQAVKALSYSGHEIVKGFGRNLPSVFPVVGRVQHFEPGDPLVLHDDLVLSSVVSSATTSDGRTPGPLALAAASWRRGEGGSADKETRVVAIGDSDFATNQYLLFMANRNLFLNCVGWLSRESSLVSIRRQVLEDQMLHVETAQRKWVGVATYAAPALVVLLQVAVFVRRRRL